MRKVIVEPADPKALLAEALGTYTGWIDIMDPIDPEADRLLGLGMTVDDVDHMFLLARYPSDECVLTVANVQANTLHRVPLTADQLQRLWGRALASAESEA